MTTYVSVLELIRDHYPQEIIDHLIADVLEMTLAAKKDYPEFATWFMEKHVPGLYNGTRDIVLAISKNEIIGIANLKNDGEKKICTLYIKPLRRRKKEGLLLVERSFDFLGTETPLITMPISKVKDFFPIIKKYGWSLDDKIEDCYKDNTTELIFNQSLEPLSIHDSLPDTLEKIYLKKNPNILHFRWRISIVARLYHLKSILYR